MSLKLIKDKKCYDEKSIIKALTTSVPSKHYKILLQELVVERLT